MPIIEKYFGRLPTKPTPDERTTTEPPQNSERRVVLRQAAQPFYIEGYHRPDYRNPDDAVYDAISDLMSERPHLAPLSRPGARQENRRLRRRILRPSRQQVSAPVLVLCRSRPGPHAAGDWATPSTPKLIA